MAWRAIGRSFAKAPEAQWQRGLWAGSKQPPRVAEGTALRYPTMLSAAAGKHKLPPMKTSTSRHNQRVGKLGEDAAAAWLEARGYRIVARNVRTPHGEIDLIAQAEDHLAFVEVKTRTSAALGAPETAITPTKWAHMVAAAEYWLCENGIDLDWQIDVIAVRFPSPQRLAQPEIVHFPNVQGA